MKHADKSASASACGKVILLGEHAVVYGSPALAAGLEKGARARASRLDERGASRLVLGGEEIAADANSEDDRARAFAALCEASGAEEGLWVEAESDLPPGGGLGSSAALGVAMARAVGSLLSGGEALPEDEVLARAMAWEKVFHGNPSGIDTTAAMLGGCFRFSRSEGVRTLTLPRDVWVAVGSTGMGSSTREMVQMVARRHARQPDVVNRSVEGIRSLVENGALALEAGDVIGFGRLMDLNQMLLSGLMLSTEEIEMLCSLSRGAGALGAKLTGAGGGGSVIALVQDEALAERVVEAWRGKGFSGFAARIRA